MTSYMPYKIVNLSGNLHRNADGMSRAKKHCKFKESEACRIHHERNEWIRDSESVDSLDEDIDENGRRKNKDQ